MIFLVFFQINFQESSGNGRMACVKGSPLGTHHREGVGGGFGPSRASGFTLGPQRYLALTQQEHPLTLAPGTTLGKAPTGWRVRGHIFSDQRFYPSEACQRNARLSGARRRVRRIYENAGPPTPDSLTL